MNDLHPPMTSRWSDDHMDELLRGFFSAEIPDPWPAMTAPQPATIKLPPRRPTIPSRQRWFRIGARLTLAASIGFILVAYLALARNFPHVNNERSVIGPDTKDIGSKLPAIPKRVTTPRGQEALLWEENQDGDRILLKLQMIDLPKGQR